MDLLYRRYADPSSFLSRMMSRYNLSDTIIKIWNEALDEKMFNMYLHSFSDKSFYEYKEDILNCGKQESEDCYKIDDEEKKEIVKQSNDILNNFTPLNKSERRIE